MKISHVLIALTFTFGVAQFAYADHDESAGDHHCKQDCHHHGLEWADANKDGVVSRDEFREGHKARSEKMFEKLDVNKDGKIDEAERKTGKGKMGDYCKMKGDKK
jgi:hypothetical protein